MINVKPKEAVIRQMEETVRRCREALQEAEATLAALKQEDADRTKRQAEAPSGQFQSVEWPVQG